MSYRRRHVKTKIYKLRKSGKPIIKKPVFGIAVLFLIVVFAFFYAVIFFPYFQVKNIITLGSEKTQDKDIQELVYSQISQKIISAGNWKLESKSIFLVSSKNLNKEILNKFPIIKNVKINKRLPQTLELEITEREPLGLFCNSKDECFLIDQSGIIFESSLKISNNMFVIRKLADSKQVFVGERVVAENIMAIISKIENGLKNNFQINIEEVLVSNPLRLDVKTDEKWQIYFDLSPDSDINMQIAKMNILLRDEILEKDRKNIKYIDLRFKDKAYYK
ncbi:MAG: hypothetical protein CEN87_660 [Parcubacteria group bacterium Licking1014_1]|nr:MAG: hypothetical protein CEN87_660 [Parcubacteria group bacterium Licking1014_1]